MKRRVVVTGLGTVNPLANNVADSWRRLIAGQSGIGPLTRFNPDRFNPGHDFPRLAGEVKGFNLENWGFEPKFVRKLDDFCKYILAASKEAVTDSGLVFENEDLYKIGVIVGSGLGGGQIWEDQEQVLHDPEKGLEKISAFFIPMLLANLASGHISMVFKAKGLNYTINSACASSTHAIGETFQKIRAGEIDVGITGGTEGSLVPLAFAGFNNMRALSRNPDYTRASRPFDQKRDGFVMAEGAGVLVLEELHHAKKRGAKIYAEILGYGATSDAGHITNPSVEGPAECMKMAMMSSNPDLFYKVSYINAHGTSTPVGDANETRAIKLVFGDLAYKLMVSSTKSMTGHLLGGAGAIEAIFTILAMEHSVVPPTINLENPDPNCDLDYVANTARKIPVDYALSNSFGFGGTNACLALGRCN